MDNDDVYDSWESYHEQLTLTERTKGKCQDGGRTYLPSPAEIEQRANNVVWLKQMGFSNCVIESVMRWDHPTIEWIDRQVNTKGRSAAEITRAIRPLPICPDSGGL